MERKHTHIGSYGIIAKENQIVLIKKARGGYIGKLDLPGGGIEHNENPEDTLIRELKEEVNMHVSEYKLLTVKANNITWKVKDNYYEDLHHIGILYLVKTKEDTVKEIPDGIDSLGGNWYDINNLNLDSLTPFAKYAIEHLKDK